MKVGNSVLFDKLETLWSLTVCFSSDEQRNPFEPFNILWRNMSGAFIIPLPFSVKGIQFDPSSCICHFRVFLNKRKNSSKFVLFTLTLVLFSLTFVVVLLRFHDFSNAVKKIRLCDGFVKKWPRKRSWFLCFRWKSRFSWPGRDS